MLNLQTLLCALLVAFGPGCTARGGGGGGGGGGGDDDDLPTETGQVELEGIAVFLLDSYPCSPDAGQTTIECADYDIDFELRHSGSDPLVALDQLTIEASDMAFTDNADCADRPWLPEPGGDVESETISIRYAPDTSIPTMFHRCGSEVASRTNAVPGDAPTSGSLTMTVQIRGEAFLHQASAVGQILAP